MAPLPRARGGRAVTGAAAGAAVLGAVSALLSPARAQPSCRNATLWPFDAASIWNMPIGSGAVYAPAGIYAGFPPDVGCPIAASSMQTSVPCRGAPPGVGQSECISLAYCWVPTGTGNNQGAPT